MQVWKDQEEAGRGKDIPTTSISRSATNTPRKLKLQLSNSDLLCKKQPPNQKYDRVQLEWPLQEI